MSAFVRSKPVSEEVFNNDILNQPIFGNKFITSKEKKVLYYKNWIESGIRYIKDLKIMDENIDQNYIYGN